jgi:hypothetical protein
MEELDGSVFSKRLQKLSNFHKSQLRMGDQKFYKIHKKFCYSFVFVYQVYYFTRSHYITQTKTILFYK